MTRQSELNATYELVAREKAYLLEAKKAGRFDKDRWQDFLTFAEGAGCHDDADEMRRRMNAAAPTSEFAITKRTMYATADVLKHKTRTDVNNDIYDSVAAAFEQLPLEQREVIRRHQRYLMDKYSGLGELGALELLASVSEYVGKE